MGSGFSKAKKQAKNLEEQMKKMQLEQEKLVVSGSAGNGLVLLTLNGKKELQNITIHPDCIVQDDVEGLQDLILAAFQDASQKIKENSPLTEFPFFGSF